MTIPDYEVGLKRGQELERERCKLIVNLSRYGIIDTDQRTILSYIDTGSYGDLKRMWDEEFG